MNIDFGMEKYVYKIENKINKKIYVGQTNNLDRSTTKEIIIQFITPLRNMDGRISKFLFYIMESIITKKRKNT